IPRPANFGPDFKIELSEMRWNAPGHQLARTQMVNFCRCEVARQSQLPALETFAPGKSDQTIVAQHERCLAGIGEAPRPSGFCFLKIKIGELWPHFLDKMLHDFRYVSSIAVE